jgi:uncharacterized protein YgiM (DUF1202 family)
MKYAAYFKPTLGLLVLGAMLLAVLVTPVEAGAAHASELFQERAAAANETIAVVRTGALNVRSGPGIAYQSIAVVYNGQSLTLLGRNAESSWVKVRLYTGVEGWVNASLVSLSVPIGNLAVVGGDVTPTADALVDTGALNVRSGPAIVYRSVAVVYQGARVQLLGRHAGSSWVQVRTAGGAVGWVNSYYLRTSVNINALPVVTPSPQQPETTQPLATVLTYALNVRSGPGIAFNVLEVAYQGHVFALLGRNADASWLHVRTFSGAVGWVRSTTVRSNVEVATLAVVDTPAAHVASVTAYALNVRYGPHHTYGAFAVLYRGQNVILVGRSAAGGWAQVRLPSGAVGWVNASYLSSTTPFSSLPVTG